MTVKAAQHPGCGKKRYLSWKHANFDARAIRLKKNEHVEVYQCRKCQCWHVGHPMGKRRRIVDA